MNSNHYLINLNISLAIIVLLLRFIYSAEPICPSALSSQAADQCRPSHHSISSYLLPAFCTLWKKIRAQEITSSQKPTESLLCLLSAHKTANQYHTNCFPWDCKNVQALVTEDDMVRNNWAWKKRMRGGEQVRWRSIYLRSDPECCFLTPGNFHYPLCLP